MRAVVPHATFVIDSLDKYPIEVAISAVADDSPGAELTILWQGSQRRLFRKYANQRSEAMAEISEAVRKYVQARGGIAEKLPQQGELHAAAAGQQPAQPSK